MTFLSRTILSAAAVALAGQAAAQVTFYEREGFQGESFTTRRQVGDFARFGFNDSAASVVVNGDPDERWQVCEDARFSGRCAVLQPGQYPNLRAIGLTKRISSVQALARVEVPAVQVLPAAPAVQPSRIVLYESQEFSGRAFTVQQDIADLGRSRLNDRISSVEVFGAHWEICRDGGFAGPCVVLREGRYPSLASMGLDNRVSSVRELVRDNGPGSVRGAGGILREGRLARPVLCDTGRPDRPAPIRVQRPQLVGTGPWWPVGIVPRQCLQRARAWCLRQGQYPSLASMGLDNQISSARIVGRDMHRVDNRAGTVPPAPVYNARRRGNERLFDAQVTSVRAVVQTPEKRCWVEREQVAAENRNKVPGAIIGAVIGGILGHQVGGGRGRDLATVGGAVAGGAIGASVGGGGKTQEQDVQRCDTPQAQALPRTVGRQLCLPRPGAPRPDDVRARRHHHRQRRRRTTGLSRQGCACALTANTGTAADLPLNSTSPSASSGTRSAQRRPGLAVDQDAARRPPWYGPPAAPPG